MKLSLFYRVGLAVASVGLFLSSASAKESPPLKVTGEIIEAASRLLGSLDDGQRSMLLMDFEDEERFNWAYVPTSRKGLPLKDMTEAQQTLALEVLRTSLSERGFWKASMMRKLEKVLQGVEGPDRRLARDPDDYYFSVFGEPSTEGVWGWRFEGHHVSLNFTVVEGDMLAASPRFFGSNPAEVQSGELKGLRVLGNEEDYGRMLLMSLGDAQRSKAVFAEKAFRDIVTKTERKVDPMAPEGIRASELNKRQLDLLSKLISEYVLSLPEELADIRMATVKEAGWEHIHFGWAGSGKAGEGHYYRVQGPTFLIEYDNVQNGAKHVHCVWRDFDGDFGRDLLKEHYEAHEH